MKPGTTVFFTFCHTSRTGCVSFTFSSDTIHIHKRLAIEFFCPQHRLIRSVYILRSKEKPFFFPQIMILVLIKSGWNHYKGIPTTISYRSEEHTSELQSRGHLVCRLLLEKKNSKQTPHKI